MSVPTMSHLRCVSPRSEALETSIHHANRFVRALRALPDATVPEEAALWLEGRDAEASVFVEDVLSAWKLGEISADSAAGTIDDYLLALHSTLEAWFGPWYAPSCCGPLADARKRTGVALSLRRHDPLTDTLPDGLPTYLRAKRARVEGARRHAVVE
jgi:hypothetical protein